MLIPKLGFVGFGEAAASIALGLYEEGFKDVSTYDWSQDNPNHRPLIEKRATASCTIIKPNISKLVEDCDVIISSVTANSALEVANTVKKHIRNGQFFLDINSVSPETKKQMAIIIEEKGNGSFIEGAVVAAIPPLKHRAPILICGSHVPKFIKIMKPYHLKLIDVGRKFGQASATKMFRSIIIKGLEAILQESMLGASKYGVADIVLESVEKTQPGIDWKKLTTYLLGRTAIHGKRRVHEMKSASATLRELGIDPIMTRAITERIETAASSGLNKKFGNLAPKDFKEVIDVILKNKS